MAKTFRVVAICYHSFDIEAETAEEAEELLWEMNDQEWQDSVYDTEVDQIHLLDENGEEIN